MANNLVLRNPTIIQIGPDQGRWLQISISEAWKTILSRTIRCGKQHSISVTRRRGISSEDKSKLEGLVESSIGVKAIANLKAKIQTSLEASVKLEEMVEQTETYTTAAGECDESQILLAQKIRIYDFQFEDTRLFRRKSAAFDVIEYIDEIWDRGQVTRNHPDCSCPGPKPQLNYYVDIQVGQKISSTEGVIEDASGHTMPKLGVTFPDGLDAGMTFRLPTSHIDPFWKFLTDTSADDDVACEIVTKRENNSNLPLDDGQKVKLIGVPQFAELDETLHTEKAEAAEEQAQAGATFSL